MVSKRIVLITVVAILILYWLAPKVYIFFQIDTCLDSGGAYVYQKGICIHGPAITR